MTIGKFSFPTRPERPWPSAFEKLTGLQRVAGARAISLRGHPVFTLVTTSLAPAFARPPLPCLESRGEKTDARFAPTNFRSNGPWRIGLLARRRWQGRRVEAIPPPAA